jgi:branched-chain amino acid transport system substrate-binding protein
MKVPIAIGVAVVAAVALVLILKPSDKPASPHAAQAPKPTHGTLTLGVLAPLSGDAAARGKDLVAGAQLAADELNARGGVLGRRVVLATADDQCTPGGGDPASRQLIAKHVAGVVGGVCDESTRSELYTLQSARTPLLITSAAADGLVGNEYGFLLTGTKDQEALAAEHWIGYLEPQRVAVVADATGRDLAQRVYERVKHDVPTDLTDAQAGESPQALAAAALKSNPSSVYWSGPEAGAGQLVSALHAAGYRGSFVASSASDSRAFLSQAPAGAYVVTTASPQLLPRAAAWSKRFSASNERAPSRDAMQAYDAVRALAQAIQQAHRTQGPKIATQLMSLPGFATFMGGLHFSPDHSLADDNFVVEQVKDGKFTLARALRTN